MRPFDEDEPVPVPVRGYTGHRPASLWRFEILPRADEVHAADAIEIVAGDIVRRVSLTAVDFCVIQQRNVWVTSQENTFNPDGTIRAEPTPADLAPLCDLDEETIRAALRRLAVIGLLSPPHREGRIQ